MVKNVVRKTTTMEGSNYSAFLSEVAVNHLKTAKCETWPKRSKMRTKVCNRINTQIKKPPLKKGFPTTINIIYILKPAL